MSSLTLDDLINEKKKNNGVATEEEKEELGGRYAH